VASGFFSRARDRAQSGSAPTEVGFDPIRGGDAPCLDLQKRSHAAQASDRGVSMALSPTEAGLRRGGVRQTPGGARLWAQRMGTALRPVGQADFYRAPPQRTGAPARCLQKRSCDKRLSKFRIMGYGDLVVSAGAPPCPTPQRPRRPRRRRRNRARSGPRREGRSGGAPRAWRGPSPLRGRGARPPARRTRAALRPPQTASIPPQPFDFPRSPET
jgi:hypothetical protein